MSKQKETKQIPVQFGKDGICSISGSRNDQVTNTLVDQAANTLWIKYSDKDTQNQQIDAVFGMMEGIAPQDEIEGMLATQMVGLHNATMECMRRAMLDEQTFIGRKESLNQANKLSRSFTTLLESLNKYRGKSVSEQKMTVEHVHVHEGGQAIVGNVQQHKQEGGDKPTKSEEQPHAKEIMHQEQEPMPCKNPQGDTMPVTSNGKR